MAFGKPVLQIYTSDPTIIGSNPIGYTLTDHNRQPLQVAYETIENSARMANGTLRRYITANKKKIGISWDMVPAAGGYNFTADSNLGAAWLKSFYEENIYKPVWIKLTYAEEGWRFSNSQTATTKFMSTNSTFNNSNDNSLITSTPFYISAFAFSSFTSGSGTASITTTINHNISANSEVYVTGVNQLFNGTWVVSSSAAPNVFTFNFRGNGNASATFKINSYNQSGNTASFNVDNNAFVNSGATISITNSQPILGSSINGTWTVVGNKTGQTYFTASSTTSQTAKGQYGDATIIASSSYSGLPSTLSLAQTGLAVSTDVLKVFMTSFNYDIVNRLSVTDIVNMNIEFTEI
jgi:hypothetical protein